MRADRWRKARDNMSSGMLFIDEHDNLSKISKDKLNSGNCIATFSVENLYNHSFLWHDENSGCTQTGQDYSFITLSGAEYIYYVTQGASLTQLSNNKFDIWPYAYTASSYYEQNELLYFIK
jgi:hypothetical protein